MKVVLKLIVLSLAFSASFGLSPTDALADDLGWKPYVKILDLLCQGQTPNRLPPADLSRIRFSLSGLAKAHSNRRWDALDQDMIWMRSVASRTLEEFRAKNQNLDEEGLARYYRMSSYCKEPEQALDEIRRMTPAPVMSEIISFSLEDLAADLPTYVASNTKFASNIKVLAENGLAFVKEVSAHGSPEMDRAEKSAASILRIK